MACASLGLVFVLALWCLRGMEWVHYKLTGKEEDKDD
eukprot:CAMPEP_0175288386 /NCGR_PEP_ID=MMETSP0093-20121207/54779_1 /TAXON_ID=311494 /ORGANISM="Alexandrium monilatum, Strain CCMP3105" /LENGTH=36 /DNA_ID= /DNA_START= /DNA_END= /DNA_ORIENTATION=